MSIGSDVIKEGMPILPKSRLEKVCKLHIAEHVVTDIDQVITLIHKATDKGGEALWFNAEAEWTSG